MRIGCVIDVLNSIDIQEFVKLGGKVVQIYEMLYIQKISKHHRFEKL